MGEKKVKKKCGEAKEMWWSKKKCVKKKGKKNVVRKKCEERMAD